MYPKPIQNLIDLFTKFPGIGPRQAARFVFFLIKENGNLRSNLIGTLSELGEKIVFCSQCFRSMEKTNGHSMCTLCRSESREPHVIAVVEKESDMQNLERTGAFQGMYHVLGGVISPLDQDSPKKIHLKNLYERVKKTLAEKNQCEIVLATNPTAEGDTTALYIEKILEPLKSKTADLKILRLGRGLSLGSELEHVDEITLRQAFQHRR